MYLLHFRSHRELNIRNIVILHVSCFIYLLRVIVIVNDYYYFNQMSKKCWSLLLDVTVQQLLTWLIILD